MMTDMEMDLHLAQVEARNLKQTVQEQNDTIGNLKNHVASLQKIIEDMRQQSGKCSFGEGVVIKPDGIHELDPCHYELMEKHRNVTVEVLRCTKCGHVEVMWHRQDDTEDGDFDG